MNFEIRAFLVYFLSLLVFVENSKILKIFKNEKSSNAKLSVIKNVEEEPLNTLEYRRSKTLSDKHSLAGTFDSPPRKSWNLRNSLSTMMLCNKSKNENKGSIDYNSGDSDCEDAAAVDKSNKPQLRKSRSFSEAHEFLGNPYRPDVFLQSTNNTAKKKKSALGKSIRAIKHTSGKLFHMTSKSKSTSRPANNIDTGTRDDLTYVPLRRSKTMIPNYDAQDIRRSLTQNKPTPITGNTREILEKTTQKPNQTTRDKLEIRENLEPNKPRHSSRDRRENHEDIDPNKPRQSTHGRREYRENVDPNKPRPSTHDRRENHEIVDPTKRRHSSHDRHHPRHSSHERRTEITPPSNGRDTHQNAEQKNPIRGSRDTDDKIERKKPKPTPGEIHESSTRRKSQHPARDNEHGPVVKEDKKLHPDIKDKGKNVAKHPSDEKRRASTSAGKTFPSLQNHRGATPNNSTEYSASYSNCGSLAYRHTSDVNNPNSKKRLEESRSYKASTSKGERGEAPKKPFFKYTLKHVLMVMRHGHRTPMKHMEIFTKFDKLQSLYNNVSLGGELTEKGYESMMSLGKRLRVLYHSNYLDPHCVKEPEMDIQATATTLPRCKASAKALVEGIYDPHGPLISAYPDNPIDPGNLPECPRLDYEVDMIFSTEDPALDGNLVHFLRENINSIPIRHKIDEYSLWDVVDNLLCEAGAGYKHPKWMDYDKVKAWKYEKYSMNTASEMALKLKVGPMFEHIVNDFSRRASSNLPCSKMQIYGSHDDSVLALLHGLGVQMKPGQIFDTDFGCGLIFELYSYSDSPNGKKSHFVKVMYNKNTNMDLQTLVLSGCGVEICPLKTFIKALRKNIPQDWDEECKLEE